MTIENKKTNMVDLTRTKVALEEYDRFNDEFLKANLSAVELEEMIKEVDVLAENVGIAFGYDTADRNNFETCKECVRPEQKNPTPSAELSFVRRMVKNFENESKTI